MSASNPSRMPFEMMAAGLPVVELYHENNLYDLPEDGCLLAEPCPEALATALIKILEDEQLQKEMGAAGSKYMKDYPLEKGYQQFIEIIDRYFAGKKPKGTKGTIKKSYTRPPVVASKEVAETSRKLTKEVAYSDFPTASELVSMGFSLRAIRKFKRLAKKTYRFIREA